MELWQKDPGAYRLFISGKTGFDPETSADDLESLRLTIDDVAQKALELFEETLRLGVRRNERKDVVATLERIYAEFPHLEARVKANRRTDTGIFGEARSGSGGIFNEATTHYTRLRYLMEQPSRFRYELGEVIRLCQWAIASDQKEGDAYVLLANAYSLLDNQIKTTKSSAGYYRAWAAVLLQHWLDTPLSRYPFTKNRQIGLALYAGIVNSICLDQGIHKEEAERRIRASVEQHLRDALSPQSFATIKDVLSQEPFD